MKVRVIRMIEITTSHRESTREEIKRAILLFRLPLLLALLVLLGLEEALVLGSVVTSGPLDDDSMLLVLDCCFRETFLVGLNGMEGFSIESSMIT